MSGVELLLGLKGGKYIHDTTAATGGNWLGFYVWEEAVVASITQAATAGQITGLSNMVGRTLPALSFFPGQITAITLTSGVIQLINA